MSVVISRFSPVNYLVSFVTRFSFLLSEVFIIATGTVIWFNSSKGFGFSAPSEGGKDVFIHSPILANKSYRTQAEGRQVTFEVEYWHEGSKVTSLNV